MKKIINMLKKQSKIIISFIFGLVVATSISYGVNQIQSSSVSYTRDGKTMSVEQAIDDLIVKVNKKNEQISVPIGGSETLQLKSTEENVTWESSNENVATVDSNGLVTGKAIGTAKITVKKDDISSSVNVTVYPYLADVVSVGDYVAYDAGSWTETKAKPTSYGQFGGYTAGQNKANSVSVCDSRWGSTFLKGWRVLSIDKNTKTVTLIHAGQPECYYHDYEYSSQSISNLNSRATSEYLNNNYATSAHNINYDEAIAITGSTSATGNNLRTTGSWYWFATALNSNDLWYAENTGNITKGTNASMGIRPVIVLKSKILTTGKERDYVGQEAWTLVKP